MKGKFGSLGSRSKRILRENEGCEEDGGGSDNEKGFGE